LVLKFAVIGNPRYRRLSFWGNLNEIKLRFRRFLAGFFNADYTDVFTVFTD